MNEGGTRRQLLTLLASGSVVGSAGCLGELSESDETDVDCDPADYSSLATEPPEGAWTPSRGNQQRTGANLEADPLGLDNTDELRGTELFHSSHVSLPTVAAGTVYVSDDGTSYALDAESGEQHWSVETGRFFSPLPTSDTVYMPGSNLSVYAVSRSSGSVRWRAQFEDDGWVETHPVIAGENLIAGCFESDSDRSWLLALDLRCGTERWSHSLVQERPHGLATDGQTVYATTHHHLYALDAADGNENWRVKVTDEYIDSDAPPVLADEIVVVKAGGTLHALSTEDGSERWNTRDGVTAMHTPTVADGWVFLVEGTPATVYALDVANGERLWEYTDTPQAIPAPVTAVADRLYLLGEFTGNQRDTAIQALDLATGDRQTEATLPRNADIDTDLSQVDELVVTEHGLFTQSGYTEGTIPERIYRFTPE
jgi:outer membrane protein assembly factor BamB